MPETDSITAYSVCFEYCGLSGKGLHARNLRWIHRVNPWNTFDCFGCNLDPEQLFAGSPAAGWPDGCGLQPFADKVARWLY